MRPLASPCLISVCAFVPEQDANMAHATVGGFMRRVLVGSGCSVTVGSALPRIASPHGVVYVTRLLTMLYGDRVGSAARGGSGHLPERLRPARPRAQVLLQFHRFIGNWRYNASWVAASDSTPTPSNRLCLREADHLRFANCLDWKRAGLLPPGKGSSCQSICVGPSQG